MPDDDRDERIARLREEAKRLAADPADRAEIRRIMEEFEPLEPEWPAEER